MKENYECPNCGYDLGPDESVCKYCGTHNPNYVAIEKEKVETVNTSIIKQVNTENYANNSTYVKTSSKSRALCGILQIAFFGLGIGRLYSGHKEIGLTQLAVTILTFGFGAFWGIIDGIIILCNSEFKDSDGNVMQ